jgi:hypothetical protein
VTPLASPTTAPPGRPRREAALRARIAAATPEEIERLLDEDPDLLAAQERLGEALAGMLAGWWHRRGRHLAAAAAQGGLPTESTASAGPGAAA